MPRDAWGLVAAMMISAYVILAALDNSVTAFPVSVLATIAVLVLPGYALAKALFPKHEVEGTEFFVITLGLNLALVALGGLVLHWSPWYIRPATWSILFGPITIIFAAVALIRKRNHTDDAQPAENRKLTLLQGLCIALAILVVAGAIYDARDQARGHATVGHTQLWMLPVDADAVRVGVRSEETTTMGFRLEVHVEGVLAWQADIDLQPGETWERILTLSEFQPSSIEARLFTADNPDVVYRRVNV